MRQLVTEPSSTKRLNKKEDERKKGSQNESNETLDTILKQKAHRQTEKEVADNSKEPEDNEDNASESRVGTIGLSLITKIMTSNGRY